MPTADIRPTVDCLVRASRSRRSALRAARATREFNAAEIGALAHLYRGEIYRSTAWRTRLDNTTNWAVAGLGLAMSISFSRRRCLGAADPVDGGPDRCVPFFRSAPIPLFQCFSRPSQMDGDQLLCANASWKGLHLQNRVGEVSLAGLSRTPIPHHFIPRDRTQVEAHLRLCPDNPSLGLSRQDHHSPHASDQFRRICTARRYWPDTRGSDPGCRGCLHWRLDHFCVRYLLFGSGNRISSSPTILAKPAAVHGASKARKPFGPSTWFRMRSSRMRRKR